MGDSLYILLGQQMCTSDSNVAHYSKNQRPIAVLILRPNGYILLSATGAVRSLCPVSDRLLDAGKSQTGFDPPQGSPGERQSAHRRISTASATIAVQFKAVASGADHGAGASAITFFFFTAALSTLVNFALSGTAFQLSWFPVLPSPPSPPHSPPRPRRRPPRRRSCRPALLQYRHRTHNCAHPVVGKTKTPSTSTAPAAASGASAPLTMLSFIFAGAGSGGALLLLVLVFVHKRRLLTGKSGIW